MKLRDKIIEFYKNTGHDTTINGYNWLKLNMLYPLTIMDNHLLTFFTGMATSLSVNIFTSFIFINDTSVSAFITWVIRFIVAIVIAYSFIRLSVICTIIRIEAKDNSEKESIKRDRIISYRKSLIGYYDSYYQQIRKYVILCIVSLAILLISVMVIPIIIFIYNQREGVFNAIGDFIDYIQKVTNTQNNS